MNFDELEYNIVSKTVKKTNKIVLPKHPDLITGDTYFIIFKKK